MKAQILLFAAPTHPERTVDIPATAIEVMALDDALTSIYNYSTDARYWGLWISLTGTKPGDRIPGGIQPGDCITLQYEDGQPVSYHFFCPNAKWRHTDIVWGNELKKLLSLMSVSQRWEYMSKIQPNETA